MPLSKKVAEALNNQIAHELESAYAYLTMSAYLEEERLPGCAKWMRVQSQEEVGHAMKIFDFIHDCDGVVTLQPIKSLSAGFKSPLDAFEKALKHEQKITGLIHQLYALAIKENDFPTQVMLQWFIDEQVEEERNVGNVVDQFRRVGENASALFILDRQLGEREDEEES